MAKERLDPLAAVKRTAVENKKRWGHEISKLVDSGTFTDVTLNVGLCRMGFLEGKRDTGSFAEVISSLFAMDQKMIN